MEDGPYSDVPAQNDPQATQTRHDAERSAQRGLQVPFVDGAEEKGRLVMKAVVAHLGGGNNLIRFAPPPFFTYQSYSWSFTPP